MCLLSGIQINFLLFTGERSSLDLMRQIPLLNFDSVDSANSSRTLFLVFERLSFPSRNLLSMIFVVATSSSSITHGKSSQRRFSFFLTETRKECNAECVPA